MRRKHALAIVVSLAGSVEPGGDKTVREVAICLSLRRFRPPLGDDMAAFEEQASDLVDQTSPLADKLVADAIQRLRVELRFRPQFGETHRRPRRRLGCGCGVAVVVFLRLGIRPYASR